jgi:hypothetical protein
MKVVLGHIVKLDEAVESPHLAEVLNKCYVRVPTFKRTTALALKEGSLRKTFGKYGIRKSVTRKEETSANSR